MISIPRPYNFIALLLCSVCLAGALVFFLAETNQRTSEVGVLSCEGLVRQEQIPCVVDVVIEAAKTVGIEQASAMLIDAIRELPALENECHSIMHILGEEAYTLYKDGVPLDITERSTMCTYGFYHGFITATVLTEGSFDRAQEFCAYVNDALSQQGLDSQSECYHGFGHAVVDDHISTSVLTAHQVVDTALALCGDLSSEEDQYRNCAGGVFNAVANIFTDKTFPWPEIQEPHGGMDLCASQERTLLPTCYGYFARVLLGDYNNDLAESLAQASSLVKSQYAVGFIENLSAIFMVAQPDKASMEKHISTCRTLSPELQSPCIAGLAVGVIQSVDPERFDSALSTVCMYDILTETEQQMCFSRVFANIRHLVSNDALKQYCSAIPVSIRDEACSL